MTSRNFSTVGWTGVNLTMQDDLYTAISTSCDQDLHSQPVGPNPHPSPAAAGGGSKGMSGGDVFILILFITIIVYFGGGMAYNYKQSGTPVIPHVQFWQTLPGLVADGCHWTLRERCGTKPSGAVYTTFGSGGSGGADAENPTTDRGGYGAL